MSCIDTDLVIQKNLNDYCAIRNKVVSLVGQAHKLFEMAEQEMETILHYGLPYDAKPRDDKNIVYKEIDRRLWRSAFSLTGFSQIMDKKARAEFDRDLQMQPPEFNEENVRSIFLSLSQEAEQMFSRGLVNVFLRLSKEHKTNTQNAFKVNRKAILTYMTTSLYGHLSVSYRNGASDELNDIDRVFRSLDEKKYNPRELESAINASFKENDNYYESEYYKIRGYKNGNLHIEFKREDLLNKANKVISEYYNSEALGRTYNGC